MLRFRFKWRGKRGLLLGRCYGPSSDLLGSVLFADGINRYTLGAYVISLGFVVEVWRVTG